MASLKNLAVSDEIYTKIHNSWCDTILLSAKLEPGKCSSFKRKETTPTFLNCELDEVPISERVPRRETKIGYCSWSI